MVEKRNGENRMSVFSMLDFRYAWYRYKVKGVLREIKKGFLFSYQRITKGYCDYDRYSVHDWFLKIMPIMIRDMKEHLHGYPEAAEGLSQRLILEDENQDHGFQAWKDTLEQMAFLFNEADEKTCQKKNPYEKEHQQALNEFIEKYGLFGEKLMTEEEQEQKNQTGNTTMHFMSELPEYEELDRLYMEEDAKLQAYRCKCKDEAMELFNCWFWHLWD